MRAIEGMKRGAMQPNIIFILTDDHAARAILAHGAGLAVPSCLQGRSLRPVREGRRPEDRDQIADHRDWMHADVIHNAHARRGRRDTRDRLIDRYNDPLGQHGAHANGAPPKWALFDCLEDPQELRNRAGDPAMDGVFRATPAKMAKIGDTPEHDSAAVLAARRAVAA